MANYAKTTWVNGETPAISAQNLNNIETGIGEARWYGTATGSANTYAITLEPAPSAYYEGMAIAVKINADNTGASTINANTLGAKTIKAPDGTDLSANDLKTDSIYSLRYNGTNFILQGKGGVVLTGDAAIGDVRLNKTFYNTDAKTKATGTLDLTNLVAGNLKSGITIDGVAGTLIPKQVASGSVSVSPTESRAQSISGLSFTPDFVIVEITASAAGVNNVQVDLITNAILQYYKSESGYTSLQDTWTILNNATLTGGSRLWSGGGNTISGTTFNYDNTWYGSTCRVRWWAFKL
jgi:hypothetical protein